MSPTLLVVDDSRASRMLITAIIRQEFPEGTIHEAGNADEALVILETTKPDLAILDMNMPGISGLALAEKMAEISPTTQRALLTANFQDATQKEAERLGVNFFRKPVSEKVIKDILQLLAKA
jgi:two-component system, chemotaxis family, chemotaxis protein CheY